MTQNWAVVIGINQYEHLQRPLKYAKRDAELMRDFLCNEAGFDKVYHFSEDSAEKQLRPTRSNVMRLLQVSFEQPFMSAGDNFWFFFSGHGIRRNGCDYLMPADGFPEDIENSNISVNYIMQRLRRCGADNIVLILDACRDEGKSVEGIGNQTAEQAKQMGVISILLPKYAILADVLTLKYDASQAELNEDFDLAEQLWIRVSTASPGDIDAVKAFNRSISL